MRTLSLAGAAPWLTSLLLLSVVACAPGNSGTALVTWVPAKTDTTGKPLKDLAGYKIHYGTSEKAMSAIVVLNDPTQTSYVVKGLQNATWYFAVTTYTTSGAESALSPVVGTTIQRDHSFDSASRRKLRRLLDRVEVWFLAQGGKEQGH